MVLPGGLSPVEAGQRGSTKMGKRSGPIFSPSLCGTVPSSSHCCKGSPASATRYGPLGRRGPWSAELPRAFPPSLPEGPRVCGPALGRRCWGLGRVGGLPGLGPPREPGRRGFAMGRRDLALFQARELPALLHQLQELRQGHRGRG